MTGVETIARVRFEHYQNGKGIKRIARELGIARDTVRRVLRSNATAFLQARGPAPAVEGGPISGHRHAMRRELCGSLGDGLIRRRSALACR